jgi:hypothetical protein
MTGLRAQLSRNFSQSLRQRSVRAFLTLRGLSVFQQVLDIGFHDRSLSDLLECI